MSRGFIIWAILAFLPRYVSRLVVAFLHNVRAECNQATEMRRIGIQIAEWSY